MCTRWYCLLKQSNLCNLPGPATQHRARCALTSSSLFLTLLEPVEIFMLGQRNMPKNEVFYPVMYAKVCVQQSLDNVETATATWHHGQPTTNQQPVLKRELQLATCQLVARATHGAPQLNLSASSIMCSFCAFPVHLLLSLHMQLIKQQPAKAGCNCRFMTAPHQRPD